ncbi:pyruvate dehydrogenase (quinone) [Frigoribacterium sp. PhB160]|uniref:pyruvate dehydrogenase n=1 Tax=Frigoribacterium sp. PhB160 TaxID=2485192 RepID=UPI000F47B8AB|nr:pyruvate dehydrogenase [Frigoribacterium sp. PhB160]ROS59654.1 pyruvate dehydrogenase (quinone) [Frigoribacterium sp. PhB160]
MADTVADQIIAQLVAAGVRRIYGIVGDSLNPIVDAVRRTGGSEKGGIDWIHVRNEEAAAFMASGDAQMSGELAVCAGSCGPGNLHLINGLYDAHRSRAKVLAIASHIPSAMIGSDYFQETHPDRLFVECSGYSEMVSTAVQSPSVVASAIRHTMAGHGVSVVTLPGDVAELDAEGATPPFLTTRAPELVPAQEDVQALADAINAAGTVAFFVGEGGRGAHDEIIELAGRIGAPIGHSLRGKDVIQHDNPYDVGMTGLLGYGAAHAGIHDADLLVLLGTDFPYPQFLPDGDEVTIAQVDVEAAVIGRRATVHVPVHGAVLPTLRLLAPLVEAKKSRRFLDKMLKKHEKLMTGVVGAYTKKAEKLTPIHPEYAASILDEVAADDAIFTADTGMANVWAARYVTPTAGRRVFGSYLHGSMANALPHALGAQLAFPGRQVVSMSGDGGLSMLMGELVTAKMYEIPVKIVVFNNSTLGLVKLEMLVDGYPDFGVDVPYVDYAAVARSIGIHAVHVDQPGELRDGFEAVFEHDGPALIDIATDPQALSLPPAITGAQVKGFSLAMSKVVMNGGAGEVVSMARSNLRNVPRP